MSFLEHLEELRQRLLKTVIALAAGFAVCWSFHEQIFHFMVQPLRAAYPGIKLVATSPTETLMLFMKMSFFAGIFLAAPFVLYQIWAFVAPGLYSHEKRYVVPFIVFGTGFFVTGAAFGHYWLFPLTFRFLGEFGGTDVEYLPKVSEYYTFYSWFLLGLGVVFQLPVVIFVLSRIGLVTPGFLLRHFRWAVLAAFVIAAIITPTPDVVTQSLLALPMLGLYLLGIVVAWLFGKPRVKAEAVSAPPAA
ncbi:MAG: twin-arginine translocase subunit TatC [Vicinamibacteria bacterium]|jgi:sec-independent protein translocase protein TatC|nr:twin-arginine translocase subunit TatC [Vicinamibacteria bacterium]